MARSLTDICNEAISDVPAHPITDITDPENEARQCARHLPGVVSEIINYHDFDFARRRSQLAEVANDRQAEWAKCFQLPANMLSPLGIIPNYNSTQSLGVATGQVGSPTSGTIVVSPLSYYFSSRLDYSPVDYTIADGRLYTNMATALLEYSSDVLEPSTWTPLFAQAVIRHLAARIYRPILGAASDTNEWMIKQRAAKMALNEAVADDLNRNPRRKRPFISDGEAARSGYYADYPGSIARW